MTTSVNRATRAECLHRAHLSNTPDRHPDWGCYHHFSFMVQNNSILSMGMNTPGPTLVQGRKIHSEPRAYQRGRGLLESRPWSMVNIRLSKVGQLRISAPCRCCQAFLRVVGVTRVYFTTEVGFAQMETK